MSRASTKRSEEHVLGSASSPTVLAANIMVTRTCLLILWLACRFIGWIVEQPGTSLMPKHHRFEQLARIAQADPAITRKHTVRTSMAAFGAPTQKQSMLWGSETATLNNLARTVPADFRPGNLEVVTRTTRGSAHSLNLLWLQRCIGFQAWVFIHASPSTQHICTPILSPPPSIVVVWVWAQRHRTFASSCMCSILPEDSTCK